MSRFSRPTRILAVAAPSCSAPVGPAPVRRRNRGGTADRRRPGGTGPAGTAAGDQPCRNGSAARRPAGPSGRRRARPASARRLRGSRVRRRRKYFGADVTRDGVGYRFITNWWGMGWASANVSYSGTSFTVAQRDGYVDAATGRRSDIRRPIAGAIRRTAARGNCGLPAAFSTIDKLWTGWKWSATDRGQYNAAWDIWLGTASAFQSFLMVWLRNPPGRQPAGSTTINNVTVAGVPGTWKIYYGIGQRPADRQLPAPRRARRLRVRVQRHGLRQRRAGAQRHDTRADAARRHRRGR